MGKHHKRFTKDERNEISILQKRGYSRRDIGHALGKNHSSIGREIKENSTNGVYFPEKAHEKAKVKRAKSKQLGMKVRKHPEFEEYLAEKMAKKWTPEEVVGRWNEIDVHYDGITFSVPTVYKYLYSSWGQHLCKYLVSKRYRKKPKKNVSNGRRGPSIPAKTSIEERPERVNSREEFGHWEGDTLGNIKSDQEVVAALCERKTRFLLVGKVPGLKYTIEGFKFLLNPYHCIFRSLTLDNGVENIRYMELNINHTYFCHPYSSWEKGSMENLFGRFRRFIPKKASLKNYSREDIAGFADIMNDTPRKCLGWKTPREAFKEQIILNNMEINLNSTYSRVVHLTV